MTELEKVKVLSALNLGYGKLTAKNTTEKEFENIEQAIEIVKKLIISGVMFSEAELNAKLKQQKEDIRQWLIGEDYEMLAESI